MQQNKGLRNQIEHGHVDSSQGSGKGDGCSGKGVGLEPTSGAGAS